jgi:hypothetical protein
MTLRIFRLLIRVVWFLILAFGPAACADDPIPVLTSSTETEMQSLLTFTPELNELTTTPSMTPATVHTPTRAAPTPTLSNTPTRSPAPTRTRTPTASRTPTRTPYPVPTGKITRIETRFRSASLQQDRRILIYLPPGYNTQLQRRYPVLYVLHGYGGFNLQNTTEWVARHLIVEWL